MIADERADALVSNFTGQWLQLRNLESKVAPDLLMFPDFDDNIRKAFRRETEMLFGYILRENRSALELLNADYTFVNERLAKHYGIPGVYGTRFRQVKLTDPNRLGLLGHGSILSLTSVATRTSPVFRGKYVLTTFLDTPPPPPPPNVPRSRRATRERRRRRRRCASSSSCTAATRSCASLPPGHRSAGLRARELQLGRAVARQRTTNGAPIDAAGVLADGSKVNGPVALRDAILSRPEAFATVLTERMMTYALGRGLEPSDMPVVRQIVKKAAQNNYRLGVDRSEIVESAPFQMRTRLEPEPDHRIRVASLSRNAECGPGEVTAAMIITKKHLSRRTFLRGTFGAAVALPLLDAMVPALTAQARPPHARRSASARSTCRAACIRTPGIPTTDGSDFEFKPVMQPLEPFRDQLVTVSKMKAPWGESVHVGASSAFLNGVGPGRRRATARATRSARSSRRRRSTSTSPTSSPATRRCDRSRSAPRTWAPPSAPATASPAPSSTRSRGATTRSPLPVGINPRVTFERMFGETGSPSSARRG